jgi:hypothetical protein
MNLKEGNGRVPLRVGGETPWLLVPFPTREEFNAVYTRLIVEKSGDKYWKILSARSQGYTLEAAGAPFNITRERVRQIEAKFQRLMLSKWRREQSGKANRPQP